MKNKKAQAAEGPWTTFHTLVSVIIFIIGLVLVLAMVISVDVELNIYADEVVYEYLAKRMLYSSDCLAYTENIGDNLNPIYLVHAGVIDGTKLTDHTNVISNCLSASTIGTGSKIEPVGGISKDFSYEYIIDIKYADGTAFPNSPFSGGSWNLESNQDQGNVKKTFLVKYYDGTNFQDVILDLNIIFTYRIKEYGWYDIT